MSSTAQTVRIVRLQPHSGLRRRLVSAQQESARVWTACRDALREAIEAGVKWPSKDDLHKRTKGGKFALHSQSIQEVTHLFLANVDTARQLRTAGRKESRYPYRDKVFYPLLWPTQAMALSGDKVILPMGRGRASIVLRRPEWLTAPAACKIVWNRVEYEWHIVAATAVAQATGDAQATVDLGQIHQCAVTTSTGAGLIVSGRGIRDEKRRTTRMHGSIAEKQSRCKKGSRCWKRLQRARQTYALRGERRVRDLRHKGTRTVIAFCQRHGVGSLYIGDPDGVRNRRRGHKHNQRMSQWEYGKDIDYLTHKAAQAGISSFTGTERGTSSRCPVCGHRHKPKGRNWSCKVCGFSGHRDLVGSINMHPIAFGTKPMFPAPQGITYRRPGTSSRRWCDRRSRPDTGHGPGLIPPASLHASHASTTGVVRGPQGPGHSVAHASEARPL
ncbi:MAG: RNA-guided endonuclease InsQ/TnpB family protein [Acidobacteriaceae bacterium]